MGGVGFAGFNRGKSRNGMSLYCVSLFQTLEKLLQSLHISFRMFFFDVPKPKSNIYYSALFFTLVSLTIVRMLFLYRLFLLFPPFKRPGSMSNTHLHSRIPGKDCLHQGGMKRKLHTATLVGSPPACTPAPAHRYPRLLWVSSRCMELDWDLVHSR